MLTKDEKDYLSKIDPVLLDPDLENYEFFNNLRKATNTTVSIDHDSGSVILLTNTKL